MVVTIIYINSVKNYSLLKYLHKEVKARPDEKIGYIVSSVMAGKINNASYKSNEFNLDLSKLYSWVVVGFA